MLQRVMFPYLDRSEIEMRFSERSSGSILLRACSRAFDITDDFAIGWPDAYQPGRITHPLRKRLYHRVFALTLSFADSNHTTRRQGEPVLNLPTGRDTQDGTNLVSQSAHSRFKT